jgi:hypothetical protein
LAGLVGSEAGTALRRFRLVAGTVATGSTTRNIAAAPPIATGLLPIVLAGRRAVTHSPIDRITRGNKLVARAEISRAIAQGLALAEAIGPVVEVLETGPAVVQTASAAAIFPVVVEATEMPSEAVRVATAGLALAQAAAAVRPAWDLGAEAEGPAEAAGAVAGAVGAAGNAVGQQ